MARSVVMMRIALVLLLALALPASAAARADVWAGPVRIGATDGSYPHVAVRANGEAVALWTLGEKRVVAAFRRPSGDWSRARVVARAGEIIDEQVAIDRDGSAIAVWVQQPGRVMASVRRPGGRFGTPVQLGRRALRLDLPLHLAVLHGHAAVTWTQAGDVRLAWRSRGHFQRPRRMRTWGSDAAIALGRDGRLHVLFARARKAGYTLPTSIWATSGRPGQKFTAPRRLGSGESPTIAVAGNGDVVAAWGAWRTKDTAEPVGPGPIWAAIARPGHRFAAPQLVTPDAPRALAPRLAAGPRGDALVTWSYAGFDFPAPEVRAWVAARPAGGAFLPAQPLSAPGVDTTTPAVAVDRHGIASVAFATRGDVAELRVARGSLGTPLPPPTVLATSSGQPDAATAWFGTDAAAADGLTVLLWSRAPSDWLDAFSAGG